MWVLSHYQSGMMSILEFIEENAPISFARIIDSWNRSIHIYCGEDSNYSNIFARSIYIGQPRAIWHETMHILFLENLQNYLCLDEGIADYFALIAEKEMRDIDTMQDYFRVIYNAISDTDTPQEFFTDEWINLIREYYYNKAGKTESIADYDYALVYETIGVISLRYPELTADLRQKFGLSVDGNYEVLRVPIRGITKETGDSLTYPESYLFVRYLFETYGMDKALNAYLDNSRFEVAFGITLNDALLECIEVYAS